MNRISFTEAAAQELDEIYEYIGQDNLAAALQHRQRLEKRWTTVLDHPRIGTKRDDLKPGLRSVTEGNYVIFYRVVPDGIQVVRTRPKTQSGRLLKARQAALIFVSLLFPFHNNEAKKYGLRHDSRCDLGSHCRFVC